LESASSQSALGETDERSEQGVVLKFMEAMGTNDPKSAAECITPDASRSPRDSASFAGSRGADVMIGMIEAFAQMVPTGLRFTISRVIVDGDNVAVEAEAMRSPARASLIATNIASSSP
jgi:hypothetical protein